MWLQVARGRSTSDSVDSAAWLVGANGGSSGYQKKNEKVLLA